MTKTLALLAGLAFVNASRPAQSDPLARLTGTWIRDSATGPDDAKVPMGGVVILGRDGTTLRLTEKASLTANPTVELDCRLARSKAARPLNVSGRGCALTIEEGRAGYAVYLVKDGKAVDLERGVLVVATDGVRFADEFTQHEAGGAVTRHRHVYRKVR